MRNGNLTESSILRVATSSEESEAFLLLKDAALWLRKSGVEYWQNWLYPPEPHRAWIQEGVSMGEFYFLTRAQEILGMARLMENDIQVWGHQKQAALYVHSFTIKRSLKGQGLGEYLMHLIEQQAKNRGLSFIRLDCGMHITGLNSYYAGLGFTKVGETNVDGYETNLWEKRVASNDRT